MNKLKVYLKSGVVFIGVYADDEYEGIYDCWSTGGKYLSFTNGEVLGSEVAAIEWEDI